MKPRTYTALEANYDNPYSTFSHASEREEGLEEEENDEDNYEDEEQPVWTFRVIYLGSLSCSFSFVLNKFFLYQTAQCMMSMVTVAAILYPMGYAMAKFMPKRSVYLPTFGLEFSLNPGPFDIREFVLICIFANIGAAYGGITSHYVHSQHPW